MLSQEGQENKDDATNKLLSLLLMTCYNKMSFYQADDVSII
jgi:hypothetical protein